MPYSGEKRASPCVCNQAYTYSARLANARKVNDSPCGAADDTIDYSLTPMVIDDLYPNNATAGNNPVWCSYGQGPNMGWVIDTKGTVQAQEQWFDASWVEDALNQLV